MRLAEGAIDSVENELSLTQSTERLGALSGKLLTTGNNVMQKLVIFVVVVAGHLHI